MNRFDRAVNKKASDLITKNMLGQDVTEDHIKKFKTIARAMIREEIRGVKDSSNEKSLYQKTWKAANKYGDFQE